MVEPTLDICSCGGELCYIATKEAQADVVDIYFCIECGRIWRRWETSGVMTKITGQGSLLDRARWQAEAVRQSLPYPDVPYPGF